MKKTKKPNPIVSDNRKARHDFSLEDKYEAGVVLLGWEVKSARAGTVNLQDSFIYFGAFGGALKRKSSATPAENSLSKHAPAPLEAWLKNAHFSPYEYGIVTTQEVRRDRKLLLNSTEIKKIHTAVKTKGYTCVPTKIYFNKQGRVKLEIALARGKHKFDKKKELKERDIMREEKKLLAK